ncbi:7076_t:CDS:1, partial [Racocetra persica]
GGNLLIEEIIDLSNPAFMQDNIVQQLSSENHNYNLSSLVAQ